ncbi:gene transfer agent family protein, partial [Rhizobiaceae sp. 2RAB30]
PELLHWLQTSPPRAGFFTPKGTNMTTTTQPASAETPRLIQYVVRPFADGDYRFQLTYPAVIDWERENNRSLFATARAAAGGVWNARDVRELLRLALIGGGTEPAKALKLVRDYIEERPLTESIDVYIEALNAFLFGVTDGSA